MGSRAQVLIKDTGIYLYTHWGSKTVEEDVRTALRAAKRGSRLDEVEYLTRIIFCHLITKVNELHDTTGYGIGIEEHGDNDVLITVHSKGRTVEVADGDGGVAVRYSFDDFISPITED